MKDHPAYLHPGGGRVNETLPSPAKGATFLMDTSYFDDVILETIESLGCTDVIKVKGYPTLVEQVTDPSIVFVTGKTGRETTELVTALNTWDKARRFVVSRVLKDEKDRKQ